MERIEEDIFEKNLYYEREDPYALAVSVMEAARRIAAIKEKTNKFLTSGPREKFELSFSMKYPVDKYSRTLFLFELSGESGTHKEEIATNFIKISIKGILQTILPGRDGFVKEVFSEYYVRKLLPGARATARQQSTRIEKEILNVINYVVRA